MKALTSRSMVSIALSCWIGFLACILGCVPPSVAAATCKHLQISGSGSGTNDVGSCCSHGHKPSGGSDQNKHSASCCPSDATLVKKQDSRPGITYAVAALALSTNLPSSNISSSGTEVSPPIIWYAGRDILLQAHVLRI